MLRTFRDEYERLLPLVEKPGRYLGNERGAIRKDLDTVAVRVALAFPEVYEIAQSHALVRQMHAAAEAAGVTAELAGLSFWADSSVLGEAGVPSVLFGPGGGGLHAIEEYVRIDDVLKCEEALVRLARAFCV